MWAGELSTTSIIRLPRDNRPETSAVLKWYQVALRSLGAEFVPDTGPDELQFTVDPAAAHVGSQVAKGLHLLTTVSLEVESAAEGFRVTVRGRPKWWLPALPLVYAAATAGSLAVLAGPQRYAIAVGGAALVGFYWAMAWLALRRVTETTNKDIEDSYLERPVTVRALRPPN